MPAEEASIPLIGERESETLRTKGDGLPSSHRTPIEFKPGRVIPELYLPRSRAILPIKEVNPCIEGANLHPSSLYRS